MIGADKVSSYTKFHFEIVAPGIISSTYNVHIFAMFEALNSRQNMLKVLEPFEDQIKYMQWKDFTLPGGFKVKVFLSGFQNVGSNNVSSGVSHFTIFKRKMYFFVISNKEY